MRRLPLALVCLAFAALFAVDARAADEEDDDPSLSIRDVDVKMEKVEKIKRRLQGSAIVRERIVIGWNWEVEVAIARTPDAESGSWVLSGERLEALVEASEKVTGWRRGKSSKTRLRVYRRGYLPAEKGDVLSSVPTMAARELRKDMEIGPPPPPEPEPEPEPQAPKPPPPSPEPPEKEEREEKPRLRPPSPQDPRLSREESVKLIEHWEKERADLEARIRRYRTIIEDAKDEEQHAEKLKQATTFLDGADKALETSTGPYLACVALVDAGQRILLSLRLKVNTEHFHAQRKLQSVEKLLIVFTGPR